MMDDDAWFELLSASVDGEVDEVEQQALDDHLRRSPRGRELHRQLSTLRRHTLLQPAGEMPDLSQRLVALRPSVLGAETGTDVGRPPGRRRAVAWIGAAAAAVIALVASAGALVVVGGDDAGDDATPQSSSVTIGISDTRFDTSDVHVPVGATVHWANHSRTVHELVHQLPDASVDGVLRPAEQRSVTIDEPGTYEFWCKIHENMSGTITVDP